MKHNRNYRFLRPLGRTRGNLVRAEGLYPSVIKEKIAPRQARFIPRLYSRSSPNKIRPTRPFT
jgi:hypothetical protein